MTIACEDVSVAQLPRSGESRGRKNRIANRCDQRPVLLTFAPCLDPFRIALEGGEAFIALGQRVPLQDINEVLV